MLRLLCGTGESEVVGVGREGQVLRWAPPARRCGFVAVVVGVGKLHTADTEGLAHHRDEYRQLPGHRAGWGRGCAEAVGGLGGGRMGVSRRG